MSQLSPVPTFSFSGNPENKVNTFGGQVVVDSITGTLYSRPKDAPPGSSGYAVIGGGGGVSGSVAPLIASGGVTVVDSSGGVNQRYIEYATNGVINPLSSICYLTEGQRSMSIGRPSRGGVGITIISAFQDEHQLVTTGGALFYAGSDFFGETGASFSSNLGSALVLEAMPDPANPGQWTWAVITASGVAAV